MWRRFLATFKSKSPTVTRSEPNQGSGIRDLTDLYEEVVRSILCISTSSGGGTGFLVRADGLVLTNSHVVRGVREVTLQRHTGPTFAGQVLMSDRSRDLAAIRISNHQMTQEIPILSITTSRGAKVGSEVIAIGNPIESAAFSLARGILSAVGHMVGGQSFLQASISINWGNSGGPLLLRTGVTIGMVTQIGIAPQGRVEGLCLAIPGEALLEFVDKVPTLTSDTSHRAYCVICGHLGTDGRYCDNCGVVLFNPTEQREKPIAPTTVGADPVGGTKCSACGRAIHMKMRYCEGCGLDLRGQVRKN